MKSIGFASDTATVKQYGGTKHIHNIVIVDLLQGHLCSVMIVGYHRYCGCMLLTGWQVVVLFPSM